MWGQKLKNYLKVSYLFSPITHKTDGNLKFKLIDSDVQDVEVTEIIEYILKLM